MPCEPHIVVLGGTTLLLRPPFKHFVAFGEAAAHIRTRHAERDNAVADAKRPLIGEFLDLERLPVERTCHHPERAQTALCRRFIEGTLHPQEF